MAATKIIATIGPSCENEEMIEKLITAGVDVFRFNLKHVNPDWHLEHLKRVRAVAQRMGSSVGILFDLQGPEIRSGVVPNGSYTYENDEEVVITDSWIEGKTKCLILPNPDVRKALAKGMEIDVDEAKLKLEVTAIEKDGTVKTKVIKGGTIGSTKTVVIAGFSDTLLPSLTDRDREYIDIATKEQVQFLALSYIHRPSDVELLREELKKRNCTASIIAKIETVKAIENFDEILKISDGIMVARGDLGIQLPFEQVPYYQKHIIKRCVEVGKPVITATQMLESMITKSSPTRAEISDVANAIYDYTDAVMLAAETASGQFPVVAVETVEKTSLFTEKHLHSPKHFAHEITNTTDTVIHATSELYTQQQQLHTSNVKAFVVLTESGYAARMLARYRHNIPIIALTPHEEVRDKLRLTWGVHAYLFPFVQATGRGHHFTQIDEMLATAKQSGFVKSGDTVIVTHGSDWGVPHHTNVVRIEEIP
jgi:pyruvate kinase